MRASLAAAVKEKEKQVFEKESVKHESYFCYNICIKCYLNTSFVVNAIHSSLFL